MFTGSRSEAGTMTKVSVIMPSYNCAGYLGESVTSVLSQSHKDLELIVVDDGSTDDTAAVMKKYSDNPRVAYIRNPRKEGPSAARNKGIEAAKGDFITFLDADDIFLEHKVSRQVEFLEEEKSRRICYTKEIYFKDGSKREIVSDLYPFSGDIFYYLKRSNFIPVCSVMARSRLLKENRFDENTELIGHEDWEFFLRLARAGTKFLYINEPLTKIRCRAGSTTASDGMRKSRRIAGLMAKAYWRDFKGSMRPFCPEGRRAILRYLKLKIGAFFIGFPGGERFNRPLARQLLDA